MLARDIMNKNVITVQEDAAIEEVAGILTENNISGAPILNKEGNLVGIVTEEDLLHKETNPRTPGFLNILGAFIYINGLERYREDFKKLAAQRASEIMTTDVITVGGDIEIERVAALMVDNDINRVPVVENNSVIGIISRADIIKTLAQRV
ncbi:CBS domain-containing protein [Pelotomaculum sp. PtaB.Bin117]|uniref:CBS domain-containing protein n=2 Tax=Pelotomaculum TaxID=191373 RepID=UPI0009D28B36|nr:CBS domain-containing protein [Pelotomaculum sp. PtaB.Bin117]OPX86911.1 MAG: Hypoxic response protein 1 [Pelotomaculum sp. PtaB.Bin117]OPY63133.1 MAG: Hypoxic response protein 1 [Pelotomaculum sp. PtaU1.Bin065]